MPNCLDMCTVQEGWAPAEGQVKFLPTTFPMSTEKANKTTTTTMMRMTRRDTLLLPQHPIHSATFIDRYNCYNMNYLNKNLLAPQTGVRASSLPFRNRLTFDEQLLGRPDFLACLLLCVWGTADVFRPGWGEFKVWIIQKWSEFRHDCTINTGRQLLLATSLETLERAKRFLPPLWTNSRQFRVHDIVKIICALRNFNK